MKALALVTLISFSFSGCLGIERQTEQIRPLLDEVSADLSGPDVHEPDVHVPDTNEPDTPDAGPDVQVPDAGPDVQVLDAGPDVQVCDCEDDDPCTKNICLEEGCLFEPIPDGLPCEEEDGDPCTWNVCLSGVCQTSSRTGEVVNLPSVDAVAISDKGEILLAGTAQEWSDDLWLSRVSAQPDNSWERTYEDWDQERPTALITAENGDLVVVGITEKPETDDDIWLFTADSEGGLPQVEREYGEAGHDWAYCIARHPEGGYLIGGYAYGTTTVIRTDEFGTPLWLKEFSDLNGIFSIVTVDDGFYLVGGCDYAISNGKPVIRFPLVKVNLNGTREWTQVFESSESYFCPQDMALTDDGLVIAGAFPPYKGVMKVSPDGKQVLWQTEIPGGIGLDSLSSVSTDPNGGVYVGGSHNNGPYAAHLNKDGELIWDWSGGGEGTTKDVAYLDNGMVITGTRNKSGFWAVLDNGFECYPE